MAKEWGVSASSIRRQREKRGIPFLARGYVLTEEQICLLGEIPDEQLAKMAAIPIITVRRYRQSRGLASSVTRAWTPTAEQLAQLGKVDDSVIAQWAREQATSRA